MEEWMCSVYLGDNLLFVHTRCGSHILPTYNFGLPSGLDGDPSHHWVQKIKLNGRLGPSGPQSEFEVQNEPYTKKRMAIISTFDELCGIAGYTHALKEQLQTMFDIEVFDLDQFLLKSPGARMRATGDKHIRDFCAQLKDFSVVNVQLEYGTFGEKADDILRRMEWVFQASKALVVTFHTVLSGDKFSLGGLISDIRRLGVGQAISDAKKLLGDSLGRQTYQLLRKEQKHKPVHIVVHSERDALIFRHVLGFDHVHHHPLAFFSKNRIEEIKGEASRQQFPEFSGLPDERFLVGLFGFLSKYKGFECAIDALKLLPENYDLAIFGGVHPQTIKPFASADSYVKTLADLVEKDDLRSRVHFMGALSNEAFAAGMAVCDVAVFPYLEVGQSSSGPIAMAIDLGMRVIASRTITFLEYSKYHPGRIDFFDIGNHVELAQRIMTKPIEPINSSSFGAESNTLLYAAIHDQIVRALTVPQLRPS